MGLPPSGTPAPMKGREHDDDDSADRRASRGGQAAAGRAAGAGDDRLPGPADRDPARRHVAAHQRGHGHIGNAGGPVRDAVRHRLGGRRRAADDSHAGLASPPAAARGAGRDPDLQHADGADRQLHRGPGRAFPGRHGGRPDLGHAGRLCAPAGGRSAQGRALAIAAWRAHRPVAGRAAGHAAGRCARLAQRVRRDLAADAGGHGLDPGEGARFRGAAGRQTAGRRPGAAQPRPAPGAGRAGAVVLAHSILYTYVAPCSARPACRDRRIGCC